MHPGHRGLQDWERSGSNGSWHDGGLIFPNTLGGYADYTNLMPRHFKPLLRRAGLPDIRFHDLRHTRATLMLAVSTNPKVGQETLGHANVSVTLDIYSHPLPNMQDEVAQNINELHS